MNVAKRIIANLTRNFGRTVLLLIVIFVLGVLVSGAISVRQAIQATENNLKASVPAVAVVGADFEAMEVYGELTGRWPVPELFTLEQAKEIGALPYVKNYDLSITKLLLSEDIRRFIFDGNSADAGFGTWNAFSLHGVYSTNLVDIEEGIVEITSGRMFNADEVDNLSYTALVSQSLADENNLSVGSVFTLENIVWKDAVWQSTGSFTEQNIFARQSYNFEVVGIFERLFDSITGDAGFDSWALEEIDNRIYVPNPTAMTIQSFYVENQRKQNPDGVLFYHDEQGELMFSNIYVLYDFQDMGNFATAAQNILPEFNTVTDLTDTETFQIVAPAMETLNWLAEVVLLASIGAVVLIVTLLLALIVRDRKYEIGTLLALGERKSKVIAQMTVEVLSIALIALTFSLFAGNMLASSMSEDMLRRDLVEAQQTDGSWSIGALESWGFVSGEDISAEAVLAGYDMSLGAITIVTFFVISVSTIIVATVIPMLYIVRLNPKKILM